MKKEELKFGVFPLYLDAVNQCGSFAGGCSSGLRSWIHYAWGAEFWAQITAGKAGLELADTTGVDLEDRSGNVLVAGVGKSSADLPTLLGCNDWGKVPKKSSFSPDLLCQVIKIACQLNGLWLFLSRKPGVNHQLAFLILLAVRNHGCGLTALKTFIHSFGELHWSAATNPWPAFLAFKTCY